MASLISFYILNLSFRIMDAIEIVERGLSKSTIDTAIQATETAEEKQKDEGICT